MLSTFQAFFEGTREVNPSRVSVTSNAKRSELTSCLTFNPERRFQRLRTNSFCDSRARNNALGRSLDYSDDTREVGLFHTLTSPTDPSHSVWRHRRAIYIWSDLNQAFIPRAHIRWPNISDIFYSFEFHSAANITTGQQI